MIFFQNSLHKKREIYVADRNDFIFQMDLLFFNTDYFVNGNKIRPVYACKPVGWQEFFHLFHRLKTNNPLRFRKNGNIILEAHNIVNIVQFHTQEPC